MKLSGSSTSVQAIAERWIQSNKSEDFTFLYEKLTPRFKSFLWKSYFSNASSIFNCQPDTQCNIDDIIANAWVRIFDNIHKYNPEFQFSTWIFTIVRNEARNFFKKDNKYVRFDTNVEFDELNKGGFDYLTFSKGLSSNIDDNLHDKEKQLDTLYHDIVEDICTSAKNKDILIDREFNHMTYDKIADKYNKPISTLKVLVHRNRLSLNVKYEKRYKEII